MFIIFLTINTNIQTFSAAYYVMYIESCIAVPRLTTTTTTVIYPRANPQRGAEQKTAFCSPAAFNLLYKECNGNSGVLMGVCVYVYVITCESSRIRCARWIWFSLWRTRAARVLWEDDHRIRKIAWSIERHVRNGRKGWNTSQLIVSTLSVLKIIICALKAYDVDCGRNITNYGIADDDNGDDGLGSTCG